MRWRVASGSTTTDRKERNPPPFTPAATAAGLYSIMLNAGLPSGVLPSSTRVATYHHFCGSWLSSSTRTPSSSNEREPSCCMAASFGAGIGRIRR